MSKIIFKSDAIRVQWSNTLPNNFNETSYFNTTVSNDGTNIILTNPNDPNFVDVEVLYADIVNPVSGSITELEDLIRCEILTHTNRMIHFPESNDVVPAPCLGLQNVGNDLYWNGSLLSGGGGGFNIAENGIYSPSASRIRLGGTLIENTTIDGIGAYTFTMSDLNGAEFSSNNGSNILLQSDNGSGNTSTIYAGNNQIVSSVYDAGTNTASQIYGEYNNITLRTLDPDNTFTASVTATTSGLANSVSNNTAAVNTLINQTPSNITLTNTNSATSDTSRIRLNVNETEIRSTDASSGDVSILVVRTERVSAFGGFTVSSTSAGLGGTLPTKNNYYFINTAGNPPGVYNVTIPSENCISGYMLTIKDNDNTALTININVLTAVGSMDPMGTVINTNSGYLQLVYNGSMWMVVAKG